MTGFGIAIFGIALSDLAFSAPTGMRLIRGDEHEKRIDSSGRHFATPGNSAPSRRDLIIGLSLVRPARRIET